MIDVRIYRTEDNREPLTEWIDNLRDETIKNRIRQRIYRLSIGQYGDSKSVGSGIHELRFFFGKGYRVYYTKKEKTVILLLCGGDKASQRKDIDKAKVYWKDYKERFYD